MSAHRILFALRVAILFSGAIEGHTFQTRSQASPDRHHTPWVLDSLKRIQTVKAGMTQADLLAVFTTEGGLSTGLKRKYVYRQCPYFKVDVEFEPVGRPARDRDGRVT